MNKIRSIALLSALLGSGAHAAGTLTVCTASAPEGFDVVQYELAATNDASGLPLYDTLLRFKPGGTELLPSVNEKSPDKLHKMPMKLARVTSRSVTPSAS